MTDLDTIQWNPQRPARHLNRGIPNHDAFGRLRVSTPTTIFDSKLSFGKNPYFWDEVLIGGATATHVDVDSCVNMNVSNNGDVAIRQTFQRWNYQPGKSQLFLGTGVLPVVQGVTARLGPFHGSYTAPHTPHDGLYFESKDGIVSVNIIKGNETGGVVSLRSVPQSEWNIDRLNGNGPSGYTVDWTKAQIFQIDYQWLGVGGVRFGIEVDSVMVYIHEFYNAGMVSDVYMSNGTQPVRYEIRSTGGAGRLKQICCTVASEGGLTRTGLSSVTDTDGTLISCPALTLEMLLAIRLTADNPDAQILIEKVYALNTANTNFRWVLLWNPTIVGTPNWVTTSELALQVWKNAGTAITMTGGLALDSGYASRDARATDGRLDPSLGLGVSIAGVPDVIALGIESIGGTSSCSGGIGFRQLV